MQIFIIVLSCFYNGISQSYQGMFAVEKEILVFIVRLQGTEKNSFTIWSMAENHLEYISIILHYFKHIGIVLHDLEALRNYYDGIWYE